LLIRVAFDRVIVGVPQLKVLVQAVKIGWQRAVFADVFSALFQVLCFLTITIVFVAVVDQIGALWLFSG
jgi:hypothetical protein